MPGDPGVTVVTMLVCFVSFRTRGCGRYPSARYSLRPLIGRVRKFLANRGHIGPRDREIVSKRHCEERSDDPPSLAMRAMAGLESTEAPLRVGGSNPFFLVALWIASRSLSSGAHSRDPLARNDGL